MNMNAKKRTAGGCHALALILAISVLSGCNAIEDLFHPGHDDSGGLDAIESAEFTSVVGDDTLTITLKGGTFVDSPALEDFTITTLGKGGFPEVLDPDDAEVTRDSATKVTITGLTPTTAAGSGQKLTVSAAAQAKQAKSVVVAASGGSDADAGGASITWGTSTFTVDAAGAAGSGTLTATLKDDTFTGSTSSSVFTGTEPEGYAVDKLPEGLTITAARTSSTKIIFTLGGTADTPLTKAVTDLSITFDDAAFTDTSAEDVENYKKTDITIALPEAEEVEGYDAATKLATALTVVADPGTGKAGAGKIFYSPATKKLYVGTDAAVTLDTAADATLIAEFAVVFAGTNGIAGGDKVKYTTLPVVTISSPSAAKVNYLLGKANVQFSGQETLEVGASETVTVPSGRTLVGHIILQANGGKLVTGGAGTDLGDSGDIEYTGDEDLTFDGTTVFTVPGAATDLEDDGFTGISTTAQSFKSLKAGGDGAIELNGTISAAATLKSAS
jgi:hypothetical protein